jgi:hypothetical protein
VLKRLLTGETVYESLLLLNSSKHHLDSIRVYTQTERQDKQIRERDKRQKCRALQKRQPTPRR